MQAPSEIELLEGAPAPAQAIDDASVAQVYGRQKRMTKSLGFLSDAGAKPVPVNRDSSNRDLSSSEPPSPNANADTPVNAADLEGGPELPSSVVADKKPAAAPKKFGTFMGVFVPCCQNILGVILFLRMGTIVGQAGVQTSLMVVGLCCCTTFMTSLSLSAIATNGAIKGGGPYYLISRALGPEFGGAVGLCFYLGTTVAGAMYILGAVETLKLTFPALVIIEGEVDECGKVTELNDYRLIGAIILVLCTCLVGGGVKYVSIVSPLFLIPVIVSIAWTSWFKMASTLFEDTAPSARLVPPRAQAAPTQPRAQPQHIVSLQWPQELASGHPKS